MSRWFVGSSRSSRSGWAASARASERARELAAGEGRQRAVEVARRRSRGRARPTARARASRSRRRPRSGRRRRRSGRAPPRRRSAIACLEAPELRLELERLAAAGQHVVAQREVALARRALVVQGDAHALGEDELAAVDRRLAGEHPQQRRLARAVAPGDRQPIAALELERDTAQQRLAGHVLGEVGCDEDGHALHGRFTRAMRPVLLSLAAALLLAAPAAAAERTVSDPLPRPRARPLRRVEVTKIGPSRAGTVLVLIPASRAARATSARRPRPRQARPGPAGVGGRPPLAAAGGHEDVRRRAGRSCLGAAGLRLLPRVARRPDHPAALPGSARRRTGLRARGVDTTLEDVRRVVRARAGRASA